MKKIISALLLVTMLVALVGCGEQPAAALQQTESQQSEANVEISNNTDEQKQTPQLIEGVEKESEQMTLDAIAAQEADEEKPIYDLKWTSVSYAGSGFEKDGYDLDITYYVTGIIDGENMFDAIEQAADETGINYFVPINSMMRSHKVEACILGYALIENHTENWSLRDHPMKAYLNVGLARTNDSDQSHFFNWIDRTSFALTSGWTKYDSAGELWLSEAMINDEKYDNACFTWISLYQISLSKDKVLSPIVLMLYDDETPNTAKDGCWWDKDGLIFVVQTGQFTGYDGPICTSTPRLELVFE